MKIEKVTEQNFPQAAAVYEASWRESHQEICSTEFLRKRDCAGYLRGRMAGLYLVSDPDPVGVFCLLDDKLSDLYIHPEHQGRRYGRGCVEFAQARSSTLWLTVLSNNKKAIRLYEKMGFRFTGQDIPLRDGLWEREMRYSEKDNG